MNDTVQELLVFGAIAVALVAYFVLKGVARTAALNNDPAQQELAYLIVEYANSSLDDSAATLFAVSSQRVFLTHFITEEREQRNRFGHALSLARSQLTPVQFNFVRTVLR